MPARQTKKAVKTKPAARKKATAKATKPAPKKKTVAKKKAPAKAKKPVAKKKATRKSRPTTKAGRTAANGNRKFVPYKARKGEEYMNPKQVEHFHSILLSWKKDLMEEVDRTVSHMKDDAANFPDPNDRATQEEEFAFELRTRDRERKLLKKIDESLIEMDSGEYGYCVSCGIEIGVKRLEARPTATLCIDCKTLDEIREKQRN